MEFRIVKKGYDQHSVDEYIDRLKQDYENRLSLQKDRIFALKDEIDKGRPADLESVYNSLVSSVNRVKQIEKSTKRLFELEYKKLSLTYYKMQAVLNNATDLDTIKNDLIPLVNNCKNSLENNMREQIMATDSQQSLDNEDASSSSKDNSLQAVALSVDNKKDKNVEDEDIFDLREAVNPTEDLQEIMKAFDFYNDHQKNDKK